MKDFIENINEDAKVAIGLAVTEKMFELLNINDNYNEYKIGREALDSCWKWLKIKEIEADDLCNYIDSEDYDDITEFANDAKDKKNIHIWYTALYAVAYTTRQAYNKENNCPPQIVDSVNDETLIACVEIAVKSKFFKIESLEKVRKYLLENYPVGITSKEKPIIKEDIMKMVDNNC